MEYMLTIGSIQSYAKSMQLLQKWELKKKGVKDTESLFDGLTSSGELKREQEREEKAARVGSLTMKVNLGQSLTTEELDYLKEHSPLLYKSATMAEKERKDYAEELKRCKTKDEVQEANGRRITLLASSVSAARSGGGGYAAQQSGINATARIAAVQREHVKFVQGPRYKKLPWRYEKKKKEEREDLSPARLRVRLSTSQRKERMDVFTSEKALTAAGVGRQEKAQKVEMAEEKKKQKKLVTQA